MHEFDAGNRRRSSPKLLKAEHRTKSQLDRSVILLDQIIEVFGRPDLALIAIEMFAESLFGRAMRSLVTVERDLMRQSTLASESSPEKCLGGRDIPLGAKQKIDCLALVVDCTIKISPTPFDFDVSLINAPG